MALGDKKKGIKTDTSIKPYELITDTELNSIRESLIASHSSVVIKGLMDPRAREELTSIVRREFKQVTKGDADVIEYIVRETIGTGIIEEILEDRTVTDIGYNGKELIIETNDKKVKYDTDFDVTDDYIVRLVSKFANANDKDFTAKNPIFDGKFENVRINAVHKQNTAPESGTTMSLRVVYPRLALTKKNFDGFAPLFIYDFFETIIRAKSNVVVSGVTGTGKTELHKLLTSFIPFDHRIILIEDVAETFMKEMFPEKDIYSWLVSDATSVTDLIKAGLRNHPTWLMVSETRGKEAYEMIQAALSGHSIITSLHAINARAIPKRLVQMSKMGYQFDESGLDDDIRRYFNFGVHIKKIKYDGKIIRYLSEIVEFSPKGEISVFKQRLVDGVFHYDIGQVSASFKEVLEDEGLSLDLPDPTPGLKRPLSKDYGSHEIIIPLDAAGRPDLEKIREMGTTLEDLINDTSIEPEPEPPRESNDPFAFLDDIDADGGDIVYIKRKPKEEPKPKGPSPEELEEKRQQEEEQRKQEARQQIEDMKREEHQRMQEERQKRLRELRSQALTDEEPPVKLTQEEKIAQLKAKARLRNRGGDV